MSVVFRPEDEMCCVWIDENDPDVLVVSYDVAAVSYEDALRACKSDVEAMLQTTGLEWTLSQVGATTDDGYLVSDDPSHEIPA